jgi:hypothetical protein
VYNRKNQIEDTYRKMAAQAKYRPMAPGDGFGNITAELEDLDVDAEAEQYVDYWWKDESRNDFTLGRCHHQNRPALIFMVEAARNLCAGENKLAARLLKLAQAELLAVRKLHNPVGDEMLREITK